ncbi:MAG TPA: pyridoxamine 5'-phosphate oxidase family protein [Ktedonobacteraceae bacterium]
MEPQRDPEPSQPQMFGGSVGSAKLPWGWATERLSRARNYWIVTTRPAGQPHSRPIWGIWLDHAFYFSTGSLAVQNLAAQPAITVHLESGNEVVIIEGVAQQVSNIALLEQVVSLYNQKYHWNLDPNQLPGPFYVVRPQVAFGGHFEESEINPKTSALSNATRWRFLQPAANTTF